MIVSIKNTIMKNKKSSIEPCYYIVRIGFYNTYRIKITFKEKYFVFILFEIETTDFIHIKKYYPVILQQECVNLAASAKITSCQVATTTDCSSIYF